MIVEPDLSVEHCDVSQRLSVIERLNELGIPGVHIRICPSFLLSLYYDPERSQCSKFSPSRRADTRWLRRPLLTLVIPIDIEPTGSDHALFVPRLSVLLNGLRGNIYSVSGVI